MKRVLRSCRVLITGGSRGIGRRLAEKLAAEGSRLALAARSAGELDEVAARLRDGGAEILAVAADLTIDADRQRLLRAVEERFGGLDILINNAGVSSWGHFATSSETVLRQVMEVNFFTPAELIRLAVPMLSRGDNPAIVNVASLCGRRGLPAWTEHSASKFALCGLTEALRGEMVRFGVEVLLVLPGLVRSDDPDRHLLRREGRMALDYAKATPPEVVADAVLNALRNRKTETLVGYDARWIARVNKFLPRLVDWLLARKVKQLYQTETAPNTEGDPASGGRKPPVEAPTTT